MNAIALKSKKTLNRKARGQGMTEYIIIVALIAIAAIGVITVFGRNIRELFATSATALSGETEAANNAKAAKTSTKNLANFGQTNGEAANE